MNKINNRIAQIHTELLNILGDCLQFDLSADELHEIHDKKTDVMTALFALRDTIKAKTND